MVSTRRIEGVVPKKPRRVLISGGLVTGGPETHLTILCKVLKKKFVDITIASASTNWSPSSLQGLRERGVRILTSPFGYGSLGIVGKAFCMLSWPILLKQHFDLVYCVGEGRMHPFASRYVRVDGWKIYHEIVQSPAPGSVAFANASVMDGLIANSTPVKTAMQSIFPNIPVRAIPFFTSDKDYISLAPKRAQANRMKAAFFGRLVAHKRPIELALLWAELCSNKSHQQMELHFFGGDHGSGILANLRRIVSEKQLGGSVFLHGHYNHDDLDALLSDIDLVLLPSLYEGLPLVLVEAMQRGIPIVSTGAGGIADLAISNQDVIVTEGTHWSDFVEALQEMLGKLGRGDIDRSRLQKWTQHHYGFSEVSSNWCNAILEPQRFFENNNAAQINNA